MVVVKWVIKYDIINGYSKTKHYVSPFPSPKELNVING